MFHLSPICAHFAIFFTNILSLCLSSIKAWIWPTTQSFDPSYHGSRDWDAHSCPILFPASDRKQWRCMPGCDRKTDIELERLLLKIMLLNGDPDHSFHSSSPYLRQEIWAFILMDFLEFCPDKHPKKSQFDKGRVPNSFNMERNNINTFYFIFKPTICRQRLLSLVQKCLFVKRLY